MKLMSAIADATYMPRYGWLWSFYVCNCVLSQILQIFQIVALSLRVQMSISLQYLQNLSTEISSTQIFITIVLPTIIT